MGDITTFMTWFVGQVIQIFTFTYTTLDGITFANTSIFRILLTITIIGAVIKVALVIPQGIIPKGERIKNDRKHERTK